MNRREQTPSALALNVAAVAALLALISTIMIIMIIMTMGQVIDGCFSARSAHLDLVAKVSETSSLNSMVLPDDGAAARAEPSAISQQRSARHDGRACLG